ncbi:MGMT family protein [Gabonibacter chumensis]|uniref:MGMT family protein n=1 Tax=Gabonibacter chumensis TaxID=2972474 RepID=UPI0025724464|nr:MGMT family protein [Gabonibacter chumensis]
MKKNGTKEEFYSDVYQIVKEIPPGFVSTYGQIARLAGQPQYSRRVGRAMSHAPASLNLPCHRVVNSQGRTVPGWTEQRESLLSENITFKSNGCVDLKKHLWRLF